MSHLSTHLCAAVTDFQRSGEDFSAIPITFFIMIAFSFMPSAWISYIVREKETKCKHQQVPRPRQVLVTVELFW